MPFAAMIFMRRFLRSTAGLFQPLPSEKPDAAGHRHGRNQHEHSAEDGVLDRCDRRVIAEQFGDDRRQPEACRW